MKRMNELKNRITQGGTLLFPPFDEGLKVQVYWFVGGEKYSFARVFSELEINITSVDLLEVFIDDANFKFDELLGK